MNIIDNPMDLIKLNTYELEEILLDPKYNQANLRELVRKSLDCLKSQKSISRSNAERVLAYQGEYEALLKKIKELIQCQE